jgi:hypothetical protein
MKLCKFILPIFLAISTMGYAQQSDFNLPPGFYLKPNYQVIDLSYKLDGVRLDKEYSMEKLSVLKNITDAELNQTSAEYQHYVTQGRAFINSLSSYIKSLYSETELWYIYAFDSGLKSRIQTL